MTSATGARCSIRLRTQLCLILSLGVFGAACGRESDDGPSRRITQDPIVSPNPPASYQLMDAGCQADKAPVTISRAAIPGWAGFAVTTTELDLTTPLTVGTSLTGPSISATSYADVYARRCDWNLRGTSGAGCPDASGRDRGWTRQGEKQPLRLCRTTADYPRDSYEGVAVTAAQYIENAAASFARAGAFSTTAARPLPQVELLVLPTFKSTYENYVENGERAQRLMFVTNNLAYFPASTEGNSAGPLISVFPLSAVKAKELNGALWESPFVLAHEYGHHMEYGPAGGSLTAEDEQNGLSWDPLRHGWRDTTPDGAALADGETAASQLAGALSEGFADLAGWYTVGGSDQSVRGLDCIGFNRNLAQSAFRDGTPKVLTPEILARLTGDTTPTNSARAGQAADAGHGFAALQNSSIRDCERPNFGQIHTVGAIFAHQLDKLFSEIAKSTLLTTAASSGEHAARMALALDWMHAQRRLRKAPATATPEEVAKLSLKAIGTALSVVTDKALERVDGAEQERVAGELKSEVCVRFRNSFPALADMAPYWNGSCP